MRVALSLLSLRAGRVGGAETYVRKLIAELPRAGASGDAFVAILDRTLAATLETPGWERRVVPRSARAVVAERVLEAFTPYRARAVERVIVGARADVVLFPQQSIFPRDVPGRAVVTVHDLQHLYFPENMPAFERAFRPRIYPYSLARADHVIAISEFTRATLLERCGLRAEKVTAVPQGYAPRGGDAVLPTDRVAGPYLYYPAATFAHKDHETLIRSYATLRRRGDVDAKLVFTGMQTRRWPQLAALARTLGVAADVVHLGFLPYPDVRRVYAGAEAVVFPSRYEGFGLPVLEAVDLGKKVIASRLPVLDELGLPRDAQIDFGDPEALLAALRRPGATALAKRPATWTECARRTLQLLREVAAAPR